MPPSFCLTKQTAVMVVNDKATATTRPPPPFKPSGHPNHMPSSSSSTTSLSSSIPPCDKSTATCSTTELSFSSITSASTSFSKFSSAARSASSNAEVSSLASSATQPMSLPSSEQTHTAPQSKVSKPTRPKLNQRSSSLSSPVTLHPQSSLLDMTMDESHDDDSSFNISPRKSKSSPTVHASVTVEDQDDEHNNASFTSHLGSSIMEQTEKNLAAISESSLSLCAHEHSVNNSCVVPDCCEYKSTASTSSLSSSSNNNSSNNHTNYHNNSSNQGNTLLGDKLVQTRLIDDFTYLLGSNVMPCCEEKTLFSSCFGSSSALGNITNDEDDEFFRHAAAEESTKVRNRAGESWRARAYRIRKLREERMMKEDDPMNCYYSLQHRRQVSLPIGKSHSADGRLDSSRNPFGSVKKDLFCSAASEFQTGGGSCPSSSLSSSCTTKHYDGRSRRPKHEVQSDPLGRMIGDCIDPIAPVKEDAVEMEVVWKHNDLDLCYDSDPGETSFRKSLVSEDKKEQQEENLPVRSTNRSKSDKSHKPTMNHHTPKRFMGRNKSLSSKLGLSKNRRRNRYSSLDAGQDCEEKLDLNASFDVHVSFDNDSDDDDDDNGSEYGSIAREGRIDERPWFQKPPQLHQVKTKALQEDFGIAQNVQDALNRTWTLTWHPVNQIKPQEKKTTAAALLKTINSSSPNITTDVTAKSPRCIRLWFERGNRIRGNNIVEPKLMWRDAYHPELSSHRKLNDSITKGPNQICLLSICRILDVKDRIDRKLYPFAKKACSFVIRTCDDEEFLFETQSEKERDELVYMWKLVVARLASQAVVGDGDKMVGEFFVPSTFGVP